MQTRSFDQFQETEEDKICEFSLDSEDEAALRKICENDDRLFMISYDYYDTFQKTYLIKNMLKEEWSAYCAKKAQVLEERIVEQFEETEQDCAKKAEGLEEEKCDNSKLGETRQC